MRVVVTGAGGRLGRVATRLLAAEGWEVLAVDRTFTEPPGTPFLAVDLTNLGEVYGALAGSQAVLHLGAIPAPIGRPPEVVFGNNVTAQFNVFEAAARLGIRRVVSASSFCVYGFPFQLRPTPPEYLPIDEDHPLLAQDAYGLSKVVGERIAEAYAQRRAGEAVSLRFTHVVDDQLAADLVRRAVDHPERFIREGWSYIHIDDAARACLLALTAPVEGHVAVHVSAADTLSTTPSAELAKRWLPEVPLREPADQGGDGRFPLVSIRRAEQLLGFTAERSWTTAAPGPSAAPSKEGS